MPSSAPSTLPWICSLSELGFFISEGAANYSIGSNDKHNQAEPPAVIRALAPWTKSSCGLWVLEVLHLEHGCVLRLQGSLPCCSGSGLEDGAPPFTTLHSEQRWSMNKTHSTLGRCPSDIARRTSKALLVKALSLAVRNSSTSPSPKSPLMIVRIPCY